MHESLLLVFLCICLLSAAIAIRFYVSKKARQRCAALLPPANYLTWKPNPARDLSARKTIPDVGITPAAELNSDAKFTATFTGNSSLPQEPMLWSPIMAAAMLDGALQGLPIVRSISHIDPLVLKAIESSTADHIHNFSSVHSYVQEHFFAVPIMTADGWFERLTGYVTEQKTASVLEAAGHHVVFAATANNPVWDLIVDGHPVQIKEGLAGVKQFLAEHHGIEVITGMDNAAAAKDPMVHGMAGLGSAAIHSTTHSSLEAIHDTFDPSFHWPIITLAFSSYRQIKLLCQERIEITTAAARVAMDVTGVGVLMFAGAKAGALVGSVVGPLGSAFLGFLGGIAGAVSGKVLSTSIQNAPFHEARVAYEKTVDAANFNVNWSLKQSEDQVRYFQSEYEGRFLEARAKIERTARTQTRSLIQSYEQSFLRFAEQFPIYLDQLDVTLCHERTDVLDTLQASSVIRRFLAPTQTDHLHGAICSWFKRARQMIKRERLIFAKLEPRTATALKDEIARFMREYVFELQTLNEQLCYLASEFHDVEHNASEVRAQAGRELQRERDGMIKSFASKVELIREDVVQTIQSWNRNISESLEKLRIEGRAIGVDL